MLSEDPRQRATVVLLANTDGLQWPLEVEAPDIRDSVFAEAFLRWAVRRWEARRQLCSQRGLLPGAGTRQLILCMHPDSDIRWKHRFQNFDRAYLLLRDVMTHGAADLNQLEKEGVIRRFEYCFELAWKTMKDFLEQGGLAVAIVTPRQVIKDAFAARLLTDGQVWIDMLDHRNVLSHTYNPVSFEKAMSAIHERYLPAFSSLREQLHEHLKTELLA